MNAVDIFGLDLWMSPDGKVHTGVPPSDQPTWDPNSLGALRGLGDITGGQLPGDFFRDDFLQPAAKEAAELGMDVAAMMSILGRQKKALRPRVGWGSG